MKVHLDFVPSETQSENETVVNGKLYGYATYTKDDMDNLNISAQYHKFLLKVIFSNQHDKDIILNLWYKGEHLERCMSRPTLVFKDRTIPRLAMSLPIFLVEDENEDHSESVIPGNYIEFPSKVLAIFDDIKKDIEDNLYYTEIMDIDEDIYNE